LQLGLESLRSAVHMNEIAQIVKSGTWLYNGSIPHEVWIVRQNLDYHVDPGYEDAAENLDEDGEFFQVLIASNGAVSSVLRAYPSIAGAIGGAHQAICQGINWDDHRIQPPFGGRSHRLST
jgi:hypothetical protein